MLNVLRTLFRALDLIIGLPYRALRLLFSTVIFNPRLGRFRLILAPFLFYIAAAAVLAYVMAPIRGYLGHIYIGDALRYTNERSLGTAIFDKKGYFVGIIDPVLDSQEDFNYTGRTIELPDYIAYPDHKSVHISKVPEDYWQCLVYHEDRHMGGIWNPFGIDFLGVLKIPYTTFRRTISLGSPSLGAGGSTLPMQLARIFFKTPPSRNETIYDKLSRKLKEWWLAPVIYWELTQGGDRSDLKKWAANHFPLAQRTGGQALYGVEQTSLILFAKPASELSRAEQFVLAAAVNQPIILLGGSEKLNAVRKATWRRIVNTRARQCANALVKDEEALDKIGTELAKLADTDPDPRTPPALSAALVRLAPRVSKWAEANPILRSNVLVPAAKYGVRDQMKSQFGFAWRSHVRGVHLSLDAVENRLFRDRIEDALASLQQRFTDRINPRYSLDLVAARAEGEENAPQVPDVVIAAADKDGRLVRYFETNYTAAYFGSSRGRDPETGRYDPKRESRFIASVGKMVAAVAIANEGEDGADTDYLDTRAPKTGLEACGKGTERRSRKAKVAFACSLNRPLTWRLSKVPTDELRQLVRSFALTLPDPRARGRQLARNIVVGQAAASPRTVHRMAGSLLAALDDRGETRATYPSLVDAFDRTEQLTEIEPPSEITPGPSAESLVTDRSHAGLKDFLSAPICYKFGTLKRLSDWCAKDRDDIRLHFAKTGTWGTGAYDRNADDTVDLWVAGGVAFASGPAYSYVILVGTGSPSTAWARDLYAGVVTEPLLRVLLEDLADLAGREEKAVAADGTTEIGGAPKSTP